jgi:uncharacterized protein YndB with AHSA1/START domain
MTTPNEDLPPRRYIELEVEVPGTPEEVWEAIATGPGITAWFVPAEVEEREGGGLSFDIMGKGMEASGVVTAWDPPRRFVYEEEDPFGPGSPSRLATEWLVEARSGGTCVVRLVNSLFATGEDWDDQLDDLREGWGAYLHNLRVYMTHFPRPALLDDPGHRQRRCAEGPGLGRIDRCARPAGSRRGRAHGDDRRRRAHVCRQHRTGRREQAPSRAHVASRRALTGSRFRLRLRVSRAGLRDAARLPVR